MNRTSVPSSSANFGPVEDEREYTLSELAAASRKSLVTVKRWVKVGVRGEILPSYMVGGRRMVSSRDIREWIQRVSRA